MLLNGMTDSMYIFLYQENRFWSARIDSTCTGLNKQRLNIVSANCNCVLLRFRCKSFLINYWNIMSITDKLVLRRKHYWHYDKTTLLYGLLIFVTHKQVFIKYVINTYFTSGNVGYTKPFFSRIRRDLMRYILKTNITHRPWQTNLVLRLYFN